MYSRSPRKISEAERRTERHVGPGSYGQSMPRGPPKSEGGAFAPFGSLRMRELIVTAPADDHQNVGPGSYDVSSRRRLPPGRPMLSSTTPRFRDPPVTAPPATAYDVSTRLKGQSSAEAARERARRFPINARPMSQPRVHFLRKPTPSAIPSRHEKYGYHVDDEGVVSKAIPTAEEAALLLERERDVPDTSASKYKGVGWSKSHTQRQGIPALPTSANPAPVYDVSGMTPMGRAGRTDSQDLPYMRAKPAPFSTTAERQYIVDKTHLDNPDPHSYSVPSQFDEGVAPVSKSFLTTAQRFNGPVSTTPAPGTYTDPRSAYNPSGLSKPEFAPTVPFLQGSARFTDEHPIRDTPAPSEYNVRVDARGAPTLRHGKKSLGKNPAFSSTAPRTQSLVNASLSAVPAPGRSGDGGDSLDVNGEQAARAGAAGRGQRLPPRAKTSDDPAFGSRAERFGRPLNEDIPAATAYTPARDKPVQKTKTSFHTSAQRSTLAPATNATVPAPNAYSVDKPSVTLHKGSSFGKGGSDRFGYERVSEGPTPMTYTFSSAVGDSTFKATHNVTLGGKQAQRATGKPRHATSSGVKPMALQARSALSSSHRL